MKPPNAAIAATDPADLWDVASNVPPSARIEPVSQHIITVQHEAACEEGELRACAVQTGQRQDDGARLTFGFEVVNDARHAPGGAGVC